MAIFSLRRLQALPAGLLPGHYLFRHTLAATLSLRFHWLKSRLLFTPDYATPAAFSCRRQLSRRADTLFSRLIIAPTLPRHFRFHGFSHGCRITPGWQLRHICTLKRQPPLLSIAARRR
jgi:hypothetical protein